MAALPEDVRQAWDDRDGPVILATVDTDGVPNIIYASCVGRFGDDRLVVADNYFDKTRNNLQNGGKRGSLLFRSKDGKAFQVKGTLEYHTSGEVFDHMKAFNPSQHPGHAAAAILAEEVYSGATRLA
ncbi:MAG: pyridoxamine 5'-phosphate oxidase family protein [Planctomycetota bacterium]